MKVPFNKKLLKAMASAALLICSARALVACNPGELPDIDLSPWNDPSSANSGIGTDITLSGQAQDGVPIQVSVNVHNYGGETVSSISGNPVQAKIRGTNVEDLVTDGNNSDIKSLADGISIAPGASATISFTWTPDVAQNISGIEAYVNPSGNIMDRDFSNNSTTLALTVEGQTVPPAFPDIDLSPWNDPSGANSGLDKDIILSGPAQDGVPIQVSVNVHNYGDETVTSLTANPVQVQIRGTNVEDLVTDGNNSDIKSLADGVSIAAGASATISFVWTPDVAQNISGIEAYVNPSGNIMDIDSSNNSTTLALTVEEPTVPPAIEEFSCKGFDAPFDKALTITKKDKKSITVAMKLTDAGGRNITDANLTTAPLIKILFKGAVYSGASNNGNQFRYNVNTKKWIFDLDPKKFSSPGTYTVTVRSGDSNEYTVGTTSRLCNQTLTRK